MKTNQYYETKYHWLGLFSSRQALRNCIFFDLGLFPRNILLNFVVTDVYALCVGHFPTNIRINMSNFVATDIYAFLCWTFSHKFTHNFVEFCRDRRLRAFVKILSWRLSSNPILSPNLSSTPDQLKAACESVWMLQPLCSDILLQAVTIPWGWSCYICIDRIVRIGLAGLLACLLR